VAVGLGQFLFYFIPFDSHCIYPNTLVIAIILIATSSLWLNVHADYLKMQLLLLLCFYFILFFSSPHRLSLCAETKRNLFSSLAEKERHY
jgi:hypothetical protein